MHIISIKHKALARFVRTNNPRGLPTEYLPALRARIKALQIADDIDEWLRLPGGRPHALTANRKGDYAVSISANFSDDLHLSR